MRFASSVYGEVFSGFVLQLWRWGIKGDKLRVISKAFCISLSWCFFLRDTFCATWIKKGRSMKLLWMTLFMMGPRKKKKN